MTSINASAFSDCISLKSVDILGNVTSIKSKAFFNCTNLTSIILPSSLTSIEESVFEGCSNLETVKYQGTFDPGNSSSNVFNGCDKLELICVPELYESSLFCGRNVSCKSSHCVSQCYDIIIEGDGCVEKEKDSAISWKNQTNGCFEYYCDELNGFLRRSKCMEPNTNLAICINDTCIKEDQLKEKYIVNISVDSSEELEEMTPDDIGHVLSNITGIPYDDIIIGIEYDEKRVMASIIVYVSEKKQAKTLEEIVNDCSRGSSGESCNGIVRDMKKATIRERTQELSLSVEDGFSLSPSIILLMMALIFITICL